VLSSITGPGIMQNMIKEIPLQYLTPKQFKRWTASVGFSGKEAGQFLVSRRRSWGTMRANCSETSTTGGTRTSSKLDIEIEGGETVRLDSVMVDKLKLS